MAVSEEVARFIERLSFSPTPNNLVALIVPDSANPFFSSLCFELSRELAKAGLNVIIGCSEGRSSFELQLAGDLSRIGARCILLCACSELSAERVDFLRALSAPIIQIDRRSAELNAPFVGFDNRYGGELVAKYLVEEGHRSVAVLPSHQRLSTTSERIAAFIDILGESDVNVVELQPGDLSFACGYQRGRETAQAPIGAGVSCVFCANDALAIGYLKAVQEAGYAVPDDLAVIGYDGIAASDWVCPRLTTVAQPLQLLSKSVAKLVQQVVAGHDVMLIQLVRPELMIRQST